VVFVASAFFGAIVGSVLTVVAQWFLGPRIERRVRALERWEGFVIELASLVDGPMHRAQREARGAWSGWKVLHEVAAEKGAIDPEWLGQQNQLDRNAFREAMETWRDSFVRAEWLARRISGDYGLADDQARHFSTTWSFYEFERLRWNTWDDQPPEDYSDWDRAEERYKALVDALEVLSARIGSPVGPIQRIRARRRRRREERAAAQRKTGQTG